jgi:hypothetical protein
MWSAFDQPEVKSALGRIDSAERVAMVEVLRRTQGASWRDRAGLGPALAAIALSWWEPIAASSSVDRAPLERWLALLEAFAPDAVAADAAVHGFVRLRDLSKVLAYQQVFPKLGESLAKPMCAALSSVDSPTRVFLFRWVSETRRSRARRSCSAQPVIGRGAFATQRSPASFAWGLGS